MKPDRYWCADCDAETTAEWITSDSLPTCWDCQSEDIEPMEVCDANGGKSLRITDGVV